MSPPADIPYCGLLAVSDLIRQRQLSAVEVVSAVVERIDRYNPTLNGFLLVLSDQALDQARQADREIAAGQWRGPLHGVPVGIKDLIDVAGYPTTAGMGIFKDRVSAKDATVVKRLRQAGAVVIGKAHTTEGATLAHHPTLPRPANPWGGAYWTGVSSSGSGVATAAGFCYGALGTDTGGSIRMPSAACGLTGIKPTWGRVSRHGVFPLAETFDHVGPMARSAADAAAILQAIAGPDDDDPTALNAPTPDYLAALAGGVRGLAIGVDWAMLETGVDEVVVANLQQTIATLQSLGARIEPVTLPPFGPMLGAVMALLTAEVMTAHADTFPRLADHYGAALRHMLEAGAPLGAMDVARAVQARYAFAGEMTKLFDRVDLLLTPAAPAPTPTWDELDALGDDAGAVLDRVGRYTLPFNVSRHPTLSLPSGFASSGLPMGVQLIAAHLAEPLLCRAGHAFQQATGFHTAHPDLD
jgi:amidase